MSDEFADLAAKLHNALVDWSEETAGLNDGEKGMAMTRGVALFVWVFMDQTMNHAQKADFLDLLKNPKAPERRGQ